MEDLFPLEGISDTSEQLGGTFCTGDSFTYFWSDLAKQTFFSALPVRLILHIPQHSPLPQTKVWGSTKDAQSLLPQGAGLYQSVIKMLPPGPSIPFRVKKKKGFPMTFSACWSGILGLSQPPLHCPMSKQLEIFAAPSLLFAPLEPLLELFSSFPLVNYSV